VTTPELAAATDYGRMYARVRGGEPLVPSITTVIGQHANDLSGWHGYMAAKAALEDQRAYRATGSHGLKFAIIRDAASASERYRDAAAARGDRVHNYAEAVALRAMGREHNLDESREQLIINGEQAYADRFDEWWEAFKPRPLAAEVTIWNDTVGYAGNRRPNLHHRLQNQRHRQTRPRQSTRRKSRHAARCRTQSRRIHRRP